MIMNRCFVLTSSIPSAIDFWGLNNKPFLYDHTYALWFLSILVLVVAGGRTDNTATKKTLCSHTDCLHKHCQAKFASPLIPLYYVSTHQGNSSRQLLFSLPFLATQATGLYCYTSQIWHTFDYLLFRSSAQPRWSFLAWEVPLCRDFLPFFIACLGIRRHTLVLWCCSPIELSCPALYSSSLSCVLKP